MLGLPQHVRGQSGSAAETGKSRGVTVESTDPTLHRPNSFCRSPQSSPTRANAGSPTSSARSLAHSLSASQWPPWRPPARWPATASPKPTAWARRRRRWTLSRARSTRSSRARRRGRRTWASVRFKASGISLTPADAIDVYFPSRCISEEALEKFDNAASGKVR